MTYHLIFDLDGTIVDSAPDFHTSIIKLLDKYNTPSITYQQAREYIGNGFTGFIEKIHDKPSEQQRRDLYQEFLEIYQNNFLNETKPYLGALDFIKNTQHHISLCTNKSERFAADTLKHYEIFDLAWQGLVYGDTFHQAKPHPQGIHHLLKLSSIEKDRTLFIGDGLPDALAAKNAGVKFIGVDFGYHPAEELKTWGAINVVSSYQELADMIQKL